MHLDRLLDLWMQDLKLHFICSSDNAICSMIHMKLWLVELCHMWYTVSKKIVYPKFWRKIYQCSWLIPKNARVPKLEYACSYIRIFICIYPNIVRGILVTMWRYFSNHLVFLAQIVTHIWRGKAKICSMFAFKFFLKFWTF